MFRSSAILLLIVALFSPAQKASVQPAKAEILQKADKLFGQRYQPRAGKKLVSFDPKTMTKANDEVFYRYNANYVVTLVFTNDGSLAKVSLSPEESLYEHDPRRLDPQPTLHLKPMQMQWLIDTASKLQPLGKLTLKTKPPNLCFESGANQYCSDFYEHASASHYWRSVDANQTGNFKTLLKNVGIYYHSQVTGIVEEVKDTSGGEIELKIRSLCYHVRIHDGDDLTNVTKGAQVLLDTSGCTGNEKSCSAILHSGSQHKNPAIQRSSRL